MNKYPGFCVVCNKQVGSGHGNLTRSASGAWVVECSGKGESRARPARSRPPSPPPSPPSASHTAVTVTETETERELRWKGEHDGRRAGDVLHLDKREWLYVLSAGRAVTRRLSEADEDMGQGVEGDVVTTQRVRVRLALPAEIDREQAKRSDSAAVKQAKIAAAAAASPSGQRDAWLSATGATAVSFQRGEEIRAMCVAWTRVAVATGHRSEAFDVGVLSNGAPVGHFSWSTYDDFRDSYYEVVGQEELVQRAAMERAVERAKVFARVRERGLSYYAPRHGYQSEDDKIAFSPPESPEEWAAVEAGRAVDADRAAVDALLSGWQVSGVVDPGQAAVLGEILSGHPEHRSWKEIAGGDGHGSSGGDLPPPRRELVEAAGEAVSTGRPVAWAPAYALAQLESKYPDWRLVRAALEARGLAWGRSTAGAYGSAVRPSSPGVLDALDAWCDDLGVQRVTHAYRAKELEKLLGGLRRKLGELTGAQQAIVTAASELTARTGGLGVPGKARRSAAKLVELGLAALDEGGHLWLTQEAQLALGLPRIESDEAMRSRELAARRQESLVACFTCGASGATHPWQGDDSLLQCDACHAREGAGQPGPGRVCGECRVNDALPGSNLCASCA